jgi:hypothetical protein
MRRNATDEPIVLASISVTKSLLGAVAMLGLGAIPNLPDFADGLTHNAYFYTTAPGIALRLASCTVLLIIGFILLCGASLAVLGSAKGVWLAGDEIRWGRIGTKRLAASAVKSVAFDPRRRGICSFQRWA